MKSEEVSEEQLRCESVHLRLSYTSYSLLIPRYDDKYFFTAVIHVLSMLVECSIGDSLTIDL